MCVVGSITPDVLLLFRTCLFEAHSASFLIHFAGIVAPACLSATPETFTTRRRFNDKHASSLDYCRVYRAVSSRGIGMCANIFSAGNQALSQRFADNTGDRSREV